MGPVPEGGFQSPPRRSKLDASEGQKNRISREALQLRNAIENDLNPQDFTLEEISDEGLGGEIDSAHFTRLFAFLTKHGYVEEIEGQEGHYRLNEEKLEPPVPYEPFI